MLDVQLQAIGSSLEPVQAFTASKRETEAVTSVVRNLEDRGLDGFVSVDLGIVRGLAYYTGIVFEIFDRKGEMRAVAGGGRYDSLGKLIGGSDLPAAGFAMGDVVIGNLIAETDVAKAMLDAYTDEAFSLDAYVVVASEEKRPQALGIVQLLREAGLRVDFAMLATKVGKQFQTAEQRRARLAVVIGDEFPALSIKSLASRDEVAATSETLAQTIEEMLKSRGRS